MPKVVNGKTLLTYADYVAIPDDGKRHEIIEGEPFVTPSPVPRHQLISREISAQLRESIVVPGHGEVFYAPTDVILSDIDIVVPDVFVVLASNRGIITAKNIQGPPDLVIEITSPSTGKRDREEKRRLYEKHGVPEYWLALTEDDSVEKLTLEAGAYTSRGRFPDRVDFDGLDGVSVDTTAVW